MGLRETVPSNRAKEINHSPIKNATGGRSPCIYTSRKDTVVPHSNGAQLHVARLRREANTAEITKNARLPHLLFFKGHSAESFVIIMYSTP